MSQYPGFDETDRVFRFISLLQQSIAVSMAQPCGKAVKGIAGVADALPGSLRPLETRVVRGVLLETLVRLARLGATSPGPKYHKYLQQVACVDDRGLAGAFRRACLAVPVTPNRDRSKTGTRHIDPRVQVFLDRIRAQPERRYRLTSLAGEAGLSKWHLEHLIKTTTGLTFTCHMRLVRMQCAADRLRSPVARIKEVAVDLGYTRQSDFSRDFRKVHGVGPRSWRNRRGKDR